MVAGSNYYQILQIKTHTVALYSNMNTLLLCKRGLDKQLLFVQTSSFVHLQFSFPRDVDRNLTGKVMSGFETCLLGIVHGQGLHSVPTITVLASLFLKEPCLNLTAGFSH